MGSLTQDQLKLLLDYDAATGLFTWRKTKKAAGCVRHDGYVLIGVNYKLYLRHRLAWLWMTGEWPPSGLDHVNCVKGDDRWDNLRPALPNENLANTGMRKTNKSGAKGVHWHPQSKKWRVQIGCRKNRVHVGMYSTVEDAANAYANAAKAKYGQFARVI